MNSTKPKIAYLSFDIEADGPSPLHNNMLSIGVWGFNEYGQEIVSWERNLYPNPNKKSDPNTMLDFWSKNLKAWQYVNTNRVTTTTAFTELHKIISELKFNYTIEWVSWPASYDWQWLNCYYHDFVESNPGTNWTSIGYKATCMSSVWSFYVKQNNLSKEDENALWQKLSVCEADHTAGVDAKAQGLLYYNLLKHIGILS